jgi:transcriptional regulator with XRE-family HTH domain
MGAAPARVSEWLAGKYLPSPASCLRLADALNVDADEVLALAGHREPTEPLAPDDPHTRIIALVKRVRLTPDRSAGLEGTLISWIEFDRRDQPDRTPNGT